MEDLSGKQLGPYQIVAPLGEGGMAAVYRAYQPGMERYVALKVLPRQFADDPEFSARFQREARILAQLQHPHILPVFDYGQVEGYSFIVMPFVPSGTLTESLQDQPLSLPRIRQVISQVGDALNYAHGRGLVHRDVKPSNVLIDESGNCLLTDFGLARMVEASVNLTASGTIMGTPAYMSPEQGAGRKIDARSDIYSLGIILYEMATGRVPYRAETPVAVVFMHVSGPLPLPRSVNPDLPEAVERVILKALARNPDDRYQTAEDLVAALRRAIPETPMVRSKPEPRPKPIHRVATPTLVAPPAGGAIAPLAPKRRLPGWAWAVIVLGVGLVGLMAAGGKLLASRAKEQFSSAPASAEAPAAPGPNLLGAVLFEEDFEGNDALAMTYIEEGNWQRVVEATGNGIYDIDNLAGSGYPQMRFGSDVWEDYAVEFRARIVEFTNPGAMVVCNFRLQEGAYTLTLEPSSSGDQIALGYYQQSTQSYVRLGGSSIDVGKGVWLPIRIEAKDALLRVFLSKNLIIETVDSRNGWGDITVGVGPGIHAQFDEIRVRAIGE